MLLDDRTIKLATTNFERLNTSTGISIQLGDFRELRFWISSTTSNSSVGLKILMAVALDLNNLCKF